MPRRYLVALILPMLTGCFDPDPPLLVTPLPNQYSFHSNGGEFGYISDPGGLRLAQYFGIRDDGREKWCTDFAWEQSLVICRLIEYGTGFDARSTEYFVLDTSTGAVTVVPDLSSAKAFWSDRLRTYSPELKRSYASTKEKRRAIAGAA